MARGFLRFLSLTAFQAEGCGIALSGDEYKVSVTGFTFSVIWHDKHSADWLAALASPYPASPDFPLCRGQNKAPLCCELLMKGLLCRPLLSHRSAGGRWCRKAPKGENAFPSPAGRLYGFIQTGAFYNLEAPYHNPRAKGASNLSPLRTFGPAGRQPSSPIGACPNGA